MNLDLTDEEWQRIGEALEAWADCAATTEAVVGVIAPLVLERAAKVLEDENDDGGCYFATRIRALAKP